MRPIYLLICLFFLLGACTNRPKDSYPKNNEEFHILGDSDSYYSIFEDYINENDIPGLYGSYTYIYVDEDTIPEMLIKGGEPTGYLVLSKQGDSIVEMGTWRLDFDYIERSGLCSYMNGKQGHYYTHVWRLANGVFEKILDVDTQDFGNTGTCVFNNQEYDYEEGEKIYCREYLEKGKRIDADSIKEWFPFKFIEPY